MIFNSHNNSEFKLEAVTRNFKGKTLQIKQYRVFVKKYVFSKI